VGFTCGLIGLPNVGKSTIFNALTAQRVPASNYPFCTIEPNVGIVALKDERLEKIGEIIGSKKLTPTTMEFIDIAGLVKGASQGEGLGNQFLNHIQSVDVIAQVVRCFEDKNVAHISSELNPASDIEVIVTELILKDLEIVERRLGKLQPAAKSGDQLIRRQCEIVSQLKENLSQGIQLKKMELSPYAKELIQEMNLLTMKPSIYLANVGEGDYIQNKYARRVIDYAEAHGEKYVIISGKLQEEIAQLEVESQADFLSEWGLDELGLNKIVRAGYEALNLITFFTANENEAHAWTIPKGTPVNKAAGKIHTDFEKGFIKAEVIQYEHLIRCGSEAEVKHQGLIAVHGKEYLVADGDLIFFKFNV